MYKYQVVCVTPVEFCPQWVPSPTLIVIRNTPTPSSYPSECTLRKELSKM